MLQKKIENYHDDIVRRQKTLSKIKYNCILLYNK
jgi:uncharacterized lipoprotein YehR (DUF1307 family)